MTLVSSADGNYSADMVIMQDPNGLYAISISQVTTTAASGDMVSVRVNGNEVWRGLASEAAGG